MADNVVLKVSNPTERRSGKEMGKTEQKLLDGLLVQVNTGQWESWNDWRQKLAQVRQTQTGNNNSEVQFQHKLEIPKSRTDQRMRNTSNTEGIREEGQD